MAGRLRIHVESGPLQEPYVTRGVAKRFFELTLRVKTTRIKLVYFYVRPKPWNGECRDFHPAVKRALRLPTYGGARVFARERSPEEAAIQRELCDASRRTRRAGSVDLAGRVRTVDSRRRRLAATARGLPGTPYGSTVGAVGRCGWRCRRMHWARQRHYCLASCHCILAPGGIWRRQSGMFTAPGPVARC